MCGAPDIPEAQKFQQSQNPVYRDRAGQSKTGRRSTILTGGSGTSGVSEASPTAKKTALGS